MAKKTAKKPAKPAPAKGKKAKKVVKPVKAWAAMAKENGGLYAYWTFDNKGDIRVTRQGSTFNKQSDQWLRVLIVPDDGTYTVTPTGGRGKRGK